MTQGISLIVGLGNPGDDYAQTRHNAGLRFVDALLARLKATLKFEPQFPAKAGKLTIAQRAVWLLAPTTFMNRSGDAVCRFSNTHRIPPAEILIVHDELDLPSGTVRLKIGGGTAGHNGLEDIVAKLGSETFLRLRLGIGHPGVGEDVESYVLKKAPAAEQALIDEAIHRALEYLSDIVQGHYQKVMNALHAR